MTGLEEVDIQCPYCGEAITILVDCSISEQQYVEDCQVCCRPIMITVSLDEQGLPQVEVRSENE